MLPARIRSAPSPVTSATVTFCTLFGKVPSSTVEASSFCRPSRLRA